MFKSSRESFRLMIISLVIDLFAAKRTRISSYKGRAVDALGQRADEGRGKRRYAGGSCNQALIPGFPNGVTQRSDPTLLPPEHIGRVEGSR